MKELKGKVAVITGGSQGIGKACCRAFAAAGAHIVFTYNKSAKEAAALSRQLKKDGVRSKAMRVDVTSGRQCRALIEAALKEFGRIDILINNAGITKDRPLFMMSEEDWQSVIDTNLGGLFHVTRSAITTLMKQRSGCIINMGSINGMIGIAGQTNYSASKAGIIGFTKALAKEVVGYGIRVNAVCPGLVETNMSLKVREEIRNRIIANIPMKRMGDPEEVADLCVYLASEKARYITGDVIKIDGGFAI